MAAKLGDWPTAEGMLARQAPIVERLGGQEPAAHLSVVHGFLAYQRGEYNVASDRLARGLAAYRTFGSESLIGRVVGDYLSTMAGALIYIGDRNGLFAAMAGAGPLTPEALAEKTGQSPRYLREWLGAMTCSGHVEYDPETGAYTLTSEAAALLVDPDSPVFLAGNFQMLPTFFGASHFPVSLLRHSQWSLV